MKLPLYMDCHATTPLDPRVLDAMLPYLREKFGNPASSIHSFGQEASRAVEKARAQVAQLLGAEPREIVFTAGATEADNLAIAGVAQALGQNRKGHFLTAPTEHRAVLESFRRLQEQGHSITVLPVDSSGLIDLEMLRREMRRETVLVSIMAANNEIGSIAPLAQIGAIAKAHGVAFHCDAAQAAGKIPLDVRTMGIDFLALSAHKFYGPKGVGALFISSNRRLTPLFLGGGQERGLRSGTLNVPGIVGLGAACEIARQEMATESARIAQLRDRLESGIRARLPGVRRNGHNTHCLPGNLHLSFDGLDAQTLLERLQDIALSSGSACASANREISYVLRAIGLNETQANASLRFGLGRFHTEEEIDYAIARVVEEVEKLRALSVGTT